MFSADLLTYWRVLPAYFCVLALASREDDPIGNRMKVLYIDQFSEIGGGQKCMLDLLPAFQSRGWQVHAALPGNGPLIARLGTAAIPV